MYFEHKWSAKGVALSAAFLALIGTLVSTSSAAAQAPGSKLATFKSKFNEGRMDEAFPIWFEIRETFSSDKEIILMGELIGIHYGGAEKAHNEFLKENQSDVPHITAALAKYRNSQRRYKEGLTLSEAQLKRKNNDAEAMIAKAEALIGMKRYAEAEHTAGTVFEDHPYEFESAFQLADARNHNGRSEAALSPALFALSLADNHSEQAKSQQLLLDLLRKLPNNSSDLIGINCAETIDRSPGAAEYHYLLGNIYSSLSQNNRATYQYHQAIKFNGTNGKFHYALGMAEERQGHHQNAMSEFARAHDLEPHSSLYTDVRTRLDARMFNKKNDLAWRLKEVIQQK